MSFISSQNFDRENAAALESLPGAAPKAGDLETRIEQWRREEWHNWFRWRVCRKGFDWSKPVWLLLLAGGFAALIYYGITTGKLFITAGGIVAWFTIVNLGFFTYFGLTLPGPPRPVPGPFQPGMKIRATLGLYPPGYERRKLARAWLRFKSVDSTPLMLELAFPELPEELKNLIAMQSMWRIQRGDAPATEAVLETLDVSREEINRGVHPVRIVAWRWDDQLLIPFNREDQAAQATQ
jgi:hypothetical protein